MNRRFQLLIFSALVFLLSCSTVDLYEKTVSIPGHNWKSDFKPSFTFDIKDSSHYYTPYIVIRHADKYRYNNIWLNISVKTPQADSVITFRADLELGRNDAGWLGKGMDDIYEHRVSLADKYNIYLRKPGTYTFSLEQIMRDNPLPDVLSIGVRVEKQ